MSKTFTVTRKVTEDLIDNNNHMHDAYYNVIFSDVINEFNYSHGLSLKEREESQYTVFTIEAHTTYLAELSLDQSFTVELYLYDYDYKRTHLFLRMLHEDGTIAATNEVMMMGIDKNQRRSAPFPEKYMEFIEAYDLEQEKIEWPKQLGHRIGIPKKGE
ncbi:MULTISPECIES: thioesterase family protein [Staphylococcus]|uniref:thioesterase family protein n=1 Tax=Staphylococcus TaxID=1279 RepID=UPI0006492A75|nr:MULTISPECIES: thioesterase family protein [Staphylococcus]MBW4837641.1 thioesterase family protein [Staphylococcaceae bacterium]AKL92623.1 bifunctional 3-hydroxyacyl-CoA dehydrogenase/thioesterase [Staphylococcus capitis subsp. capitis]MBW4843753.1 thioesterase family protein [Staphylococcaceae bacterium]MCC0830129.1 thioesterase family protein [Staphylococcus capitis]MCC3743945.1 thioesterase family protein [Staphylococcus capitis]